MLELKNITKSYGEPGSSAHHIVLNDLSFTIAKGEKIAIVGPSGCGKTTFLNIAGAMDIPDSGEIIFDGEILSNFTKSGMAGFRNKQLGFIFQMHHLLPQLSLLENILLPLIPNNKRLLKTDMEWAEYLLNKAGIWQQRDQKPAELSGGECQRTAVVRSLINKPKLILADEPTGALDEKNAENISDLLLLLSEEQESSLIVVTHSQVLANKMGKTYSMHNGTLK